MDILYKKRISVKSNNWIIIKILSKHDNEKRYLFLIWHDMMSIMIIHFSYTASNKNDFVIEPLGMSVAISYLFPSFSYYFNQLLTSLSSCEKAIPKFGIARKMATRDCMVLLYTTGRYCLKSSEVNPLSWIILEAEKTKTWWTTQHE